MKQRLVYIIAGALTASSMFGGNPERVGQAGAGQLLINPYSRNVGMAGANSARVSGLEAQFLNIAGTAFTRKTELMFHRTNWFGGTGINLNAFGVTQGVGETGTLGFGVVTLNSGNIETTTEEQPDGGLGSYQVSMMNINLSYAKKFSDAIYGGLNVKIINEQLPNLKARGIALDAGIQYHTGKYENIHFGIALRNWGPKMFYQGDGLSRQVTVNSISNSYELTVNNRSGSFELPAMVNIGAAYDFFLTKDSSGVSRMHRLSVSGNYCSNSFTYDNGMFGMEYAWKEMIMLRAGMVLEKGLFSESTKRTAMNGPTAGLTIELPFGEKKSTVGLDYAYRFTNPFGGIHTFGLRVNL